MKKYFIVSEKSSLYKEVVNYEESLEKIINCYKEFKKITGVTSEEFIPGQENLGIKLNDVDWNKFSKQFKKNEIPNNANFLRINSELLRVWKAILINNNVKVLGKPNLYFNYFTKYTNIFGCRYSQSLFRYKGKVYGSFEITSNFELPDELIEIKASEFYKIIEEIEADSKC